MEAGTSKLDSATRVAVTTIGERSPGAPPSACAKLHHGVAASTNARCLFIKLPFPMCSHCLQRLLQIRYQVIGMLDADGNPDQTLANADALAGFLRYARVRRARGVR